MNILYHAYTEIENSPRILIVEDDLDDQVLLKTAFDHILEDTALYFVSSVSEAIDFLELTPDHELPNLIVTDFALPKQNGLRLIQQLNTDPRYTGIEKVILSSSLDFPASINQHVKLNKCFVKPHSFSEMKLLAGALLNLCHKQLAV